MMDSTSLVVALCRRRVAVDVLQTASVVLADPACRAALVDRARRLRVLGLVLVRLHRASVFETLPARASDELRALLMQTRRAAAWLDLERDRLLSGMRRAGIEPVLLKGSGLRRSLYTDPAEREIGDIDLLVGEEALDTSLSVALAAGYALPPDAVSEAYRRHHFHLRLSHPFGHVVEIHWALTEPDSRFRLDPTPAMRESIVVPRRDGPPLRVPRPEHMLLHLVLQNVQEHFLWFSRLVDVDRILASTTSLDPDVVGKGARTAGLQTALALTLALSQRILGAEVPAGMLACVRPSPAVRVHLALLSPVHRMLAPERPRPNAADRLLQLWLLPGAWPRTTALAGILTEGSFSDPFNRALGRIEPSSIAGRLRALIKLAAYQAGLYVSGAASCLRKRRGVAISLWSRTVADARL